MKKIIVIGGAPCTGKSTLAKELSKRFNCPWISTDFIRSWMKTITSKDEYPNLFNFTNITAEEHYKKYSIDETMSSSKLRNIEVFKGIKTFIEKNNDWDFFIIEGISVLPELISGLKSDNYIIYPVYLIEENKERIKEILFSRGLWDDADKYEDWVKTMEQEYLLKTNSYYLNERIKLDLPYFKIKEDRNKTINEVVMSLNSKLNKNISK